ncbi:MAG: hypothetical protein U0350_21655 [Caldilineaceae bacterium]
MLAQAAVVERKVAPSAEASVAAIMAKLQELQPEQLAEVLQFVEFLAFKAWFTTDDPAEDEAMRQAILAHEQYKAEHPEERPEIYKSGEEFLAAYADI